MLMSTPGAGHNQPPGRWIAIDVGMLEHPVVGWKQPVAPADPKKKAASRCEAWIDLIRFARWKAGAADNQGTTVYVERGEMMASLSFLANRWNWTVKQVRGFMDRLEREMMIAKTDPQPVPKPLPKPGTPEGTSKGQQKGKRRNNFTQHYRIENYELYQSYREMEEYLEGKRPDQPEVIPEGKRRASEGQESIPSRYQEDNYTEERARAPEPQPVPDDLSDRLCDAAGRAIANPAGAPGLLVLSDPIHWLESGCHLQHDILPVIQARCAKAKPASVRSWSYFSQAVFEARDRRLAPAPDPIARAGPASNDWRDEARARTERAWAALDDDGGAQ